MLRKFSATSHNLLSQRESRFPPKKSSVVHLKFIIYEIDRSGTVEHLCVFQDERIECIYVPENTGKLAEYRTCKVVNPGNRALRLSSASRSGWNLILLRSEIRWVLLGASDVKFAFC